MGKLSGSYESVVGGVSEQVPQNRRSGQHFAQVNMVSDPVRGLARRHGSVLQHEIAQPAIPANWDHHVADTANHRVFQFFVDGVEYDFIVRSAAAPGGLVREGFSWAFNKDARQFINVVYNTPDTSLDALCSGGVSAFVNLGRYIYMAGHTLLPSYNRQTPWADAANQTKMLAWIRVGAYSREFKVILTKPDGSTVTGKYKTVSASYPGTLDTSDIILVTGTDGEGNAILNENYQKEINDRTNEYQSAVTQWIGTAAADITPENIAAKIAEDLVSQGVTATSLNGNVLVEDADFIEISRDDGGDGSAMIAVGNTIDNVDLVSTYHWAGKVIKVQAEDDNTNAVYLRATAKDGVSTGWTEVIWRETAGVLTAPQTVFIMGTVVGSTLYLASSAAALSALVGFAVPDYKPSKVGDDLSSPLPELFGRKISYLGVFQDRLVIGSGSTLLFSRPGDYLNWFRKTVLSVQDDDPWEGFALGTEDDTISWSVNYDRNLMLYGERFQYIVSGRQVFTPKTASIMSGSAYEEAVDAAPQASGNFVFYGKVTGRPGKETASIHQVQAGLVNDSPESYNASQQLDTYLAGRPHEIITLTAPNMVVLRTKTQRNKVYTYSYLDSSNAAERLFDSWSHWEWDKARVGNLVGISRHDGDLLFYTLKVGQNKAGTNTGWIAAELFVRDSVLSDYPYADSLRPLTYYDGVTDSYLNDNTADDQSCVAIEAGDERQFVGTYLDNLQQFREAYPDKTAVSWVGVNFPAFVTPTNPYPKDRNDKPILDGRLTLQRVTAAVADTGGMVVSVTTRGQTKTVLDYIGRNLNAPTNLIGVQPIVSTNVTAIVGAEVKECSYTLLAKKWLPLTITSIDWAGQFFFNTRRA